jgi:glutamate-ammonia-ligase adenylyltransferase
MNLDFLPSKNDLPRLGDAERAELGFEHWQESLSRLSDRELLDFAERLSDDPAGRYLLEAIFSNSGFLTTCVLNDLAFFSNLLRDGPESCFTELLEGLASGPGKSTDHDRVARELRQAKRRAALTIGLADISGRWELRRVYEALSDFADTALDAAIGHLLLRAAERGDLELDDRETPLSGCGYSVLAMGKMGARELNYSSDIDLIVLYDPQKIDYRHSRGLAEGMVRLTRDLVNLLEERTRDGYVFRTDLRLRPDPGATPLALDLDSAITYYESLGQNWERAAMIKARAAAGDKQVGEAFLKELTPFVWRRNLDFWAIQDVHSIKRQINAQKGGSVVAVEGHNIKLGRGGIREIEFYAQTQQLIFGGREAALRTPRTLDALDALAEAQRIDREDAETLTAAYIFLRRLENRLQMVEDKQTHSLPEDEAGLAKVAAFMGYEDAAGFREDLLRHLRAVEDRYAHLFEEAPSLSGPGNLVFTGGEPDPDTLKTLAELGFSDGEQVFNLVRTWHHGRYRAMRSERSRQLLTEIMPTLLQQLAETRNPDTALLKFDDFLRGLPSGVQLFSMLYQNPKLLELLAEIMGGAPALAEHLSRNAALLEAVLAPGFFEPLPEREALSAELEKMLGRAQDFQDLLDLARRWANDHKFQVGVQILHASSEIEETEAALTDIAETALVGLLPPVEAELAERHGKLPGKGLAVLALGKLGARRMTVTSDLDLVFVYDSPGETVTSDGEKPLPPSQYYGRLAQRLITALSSPTGEGRLYEVDPRLRPSGSSGPIATSLKGLLDYERDSAWTWELMALTRGRVVAGGPEFRAEVETGLREILTLERDPAKLLRDADDMRRRLEKEFPAKNRWDVKNDRGGLLDLDFVAQALQLCHAHDKPGVLASSTQDAFQNLASEGVLPEKEAKALIEANRLLRRIQGFLRLSAGTDFTEKGAPEGQKAALARACGVDDFAGVRRAMKTAVKTGKKAYEAHIAEPARNSAEDT